MITHTQVVSLNYACDITDVHLPHVYNDITHSMFITTHVTQKPTTEVKGSLVAVGGH